MILKIDITGTRFDFSINFSEFISGEARYKLPKIRADSLLRFNELALSYISDPFVKCF